MKKALSFEGPTAAFVLSLIGGVIILLGGLATAAIGAVLTFFIGGIGAISCLVGALWGVLTIVLAIMLNSNPSNHTSYGVLILVFTILSWFGAFDGFFIGFLLGFIGGILAITWHPVRATRAKRLSRDPFEHHQQRLGRLCNKLVLTRITFCLTAGLARATVGSVQSVL